ncbi:MAG: hypothetical protein WCS90_01225, partial [Bacilli bacterium]
KKLLTEKNKRGEIVMIDLGIDCGVNRRSFFRRFPDLTDSVKWACLKDADRPYTAARRPSKKAPFVFRFDAER